MDNFGKSLYTHLPSDGQGTVMWSVYSQPTHESQRVKESWDKADNWPYRRISVNKKGAADLLAVNVLPLMKKLCS